ncbi:MAG: hypothetical protein RIT43_79 [Bacteroidota bacterium]|jgi:pantetheine-phosphate adenylyltransferase
MKKALFAGSFDPFTKGHEGIVHKSLELFDEVVIAIGINSTKTGYFDLEKRRAHIASLFSERPVEIITFNKLTVDLCKEKNATHLVRGLRDSKDFSYERSIAHMNATMSGITTVFFLTEQEYASINSTIVREIHRNGGNIEPFVTNPHLLV